MAEKTNAVRIIEKHKIDYNLYTYPHEKDSPPDGITVAGLLEKPRECVFKTLVTHSGKEVFAFMIPVALELDLKAGAKAAGVKSLEMLPLADLLKTTGYVRGGCSPVGMKKNYPVFADASALGFEKIIFSAGRIGLQAELSPADLVKVCSATFVPCAR